VGRVEEGTITAKLVSNRLIGFGGLTVHGNGSTCQEGNEEDKYV
jgi:hypothetical protein